MIRKANLKDVKDIYGLLQIYGKQGILLPRPLSQIYDHLRDFSVFIDETENKLVGCCALQFCWEGLAEIRSLAVHPDHRQKKIGSKLLESAQSEAEAFHISQIFTLTYKPDFFKKHGFAVIDKSELPLKIWGDCLMCVKYPDCDETAMVKYIDTQS